MPATSPSELRSSERTFPRAATEPMRTRARRPPAGAASEGRRLLIRGRPAGRATAAAGPVGAQAQRLDHEADALAVLATVLDHPRLHAGLDEDLRPFLTCGRATFSASQ